MNLSQFEAVVRETMGGLPEWVQNALDNIEILVVEEADEDLDPDGEGLLVPPAAPGTGAAFGRTS
jgi:hypothetical protein